MHRVACTAPRSAGSDSPKLAQPGREDGFSCRHTICGASVGDSTRQEKKVGK